MGLPFFTVGHSDRTITEFIAVLHTAEIDLVIDVRRLPGSRRNPQFDEEALGESLRGAGIHFSRIAELSGRRPVSRDVPFEVNAFWQNRSFHNYADHALSEEFGEGLNLLRERGRRRRTAVMCSEAVWWRCHRRIIADHLLARNEEVIHLMGESRQQAAVLTSGAEVREDGAVVYPASGALLQE
ncbi:DUF488 domain-containing protein [Microbacterium sp.]|uniref:DUF488 domain-containing protein n=1 Tax=Microbacterium sp. TaxID=51671 RepID=UPI002810EDD2|nr:DUF488 domain-containing protein [Microbacterium sp.]